MNTEQPLWWYQDIKKAQDISPPQNKWMLTATQEYVSAAACRIVITFLPKYLNEQSLWDKIRVQDLLLWWFVFLRRAALLWQLPSCLAIANTALSGGGTRLALVRALQLLPWPFHVTNYLGWGSRPATKRYKIRPQALAANFEWLVSDLWVLSGATL